MSLQLASDAEDEPALKAAGEDQRWLRRLRRPPPFPSRPRAESILSSALAGREGKLLVLLERDSSIFGESRKAEGEEELMRARLRPSGLSLAGCPAWFWLVRERLIAGIHGP